MVHAGPSLPSAECGRDGDVLRSRRFDDIYYSRSGGTAEKRHVFLDGCGLPDGWGTAPVFTVAELGFGSGLNFLVTWDAWRRHRTTPGARLHYIAVEGFPLSVAEMTEVCRTRSEFGPLAQAIARAYPDPQRGFQRVHLAAGDDTPIVLTLLFGDVEEMLGALEADIDAWYLDGFAPDRNPEMWSAEVMGEIARLSHGGEHPTRLATYTAAGSVRHGLEAVGFDVARAEGFGEKRDMLRARFRGPSPPTSALQPWFARPAPRQRGHAAIVGAGIAGASMSHALRRRGWDVTLIDRRAAPGLEASGNPVGVMMPRLTAADSIEGRFHAAAWRFALNVLADVGDADTTIAFQQSGVLQIVEDNADAARMANIAARGVLPASYLAFLSAQEATEVAGVPVPRPGLYFPQAGTLVPPALCRALARDARFRQADVGGVDHTGDAIGVTDTDGAPVCRADIIVYANALGTLDAATWLPLSARRGQITFVPPSSASRNLRTVLASNVTLAPLREDRHYLGATFAWTDAAEAAQELRTEDHARNLAALQAIAPDLFPDADAAALEGRAGLRCMTPDHLPVSGALPDRNAYLSDYAALRHGQHWVRYAAARYVPGVYVLAGLGARGLVTAPLAAEILACHITGEPWPIERDLVTALHPARFLVRELKRVRA